MRPLRRGFAHLFFYHLKPSFDFSYYHVVHINFKMSQKPSVVMAEKYHASLCVYRDITKKNKS